MPGQPKPPQLNRTKGVIVGDDVRTLFEYARKHKFAIPAINVTSSSTTVAALEAAQNLKAPIILQVSSGGSAFFAGKGVKLGKHEAMVEGSVAAANFIRSIAPSYGVPVVLHSDHCHPEDLPWLDGMLDADIAHRGPDGKGEPLFSSHMIDLSELADEENIKTTRQYLEKSVKAGTWLEMEIGVTGGEEDGKNNEKNTKLYTNPKDIWDVYRQLSEVSKNFSIAAAFGNVHGVYKVGAVKLRPWLLGKHQKYIKAKLEKGADAQVEGAEIPDEQDLHPEPEDPNEDPEKKNPVFFVFHGGSGSAKGEFLTAIGHGVVKVNLDTDMQFAYCDAVRDYMVYNLQRLETPVGTRKDPNGPPNKNFFDPRKWMREAEKSMVKRVEEALKDFNAAGKWETS
ncbi:hypothetical protein DL764_007611 [Monosporascus ibericus]|uniref:Fructose-bisphosphate aldolase n=1 Tax=Monosporascus ibericus TaxID=155417 RepID=A0A4Q4T1T9_9PEZI|nr:hypothetical protein DL764_007611 [Monosporascus ibericus]